MNVEEDLAPDPRVPWLLVGDRDAGSDEPETYHNIFTGARIVYHSPGGRGRVAFPAYWTFVLVGAGTSGAVLGKDPRELIPELGSRIVDGRPPRNPTQ